MPDAVERNIYFYRFVNPLGPGSLPEPVDISQVLSVLKANGADAEKRYWSDSGETHFSIVDGKDRVRFAYTRRRALPQIEDDGKLSNLELRPKAGLAEQIHVRFFSESIAASDYNHFGPRMSRFGLFITATTGMAVAFNPLVKGSVVNELDQMKEIALVELKVDTSFASGIRRHDPSLGDAIAAAGRASGGGVVELRLGPKRYSRKSVDQGILRRLRRIVADPEASEHVHILRVTGRGSAGEVDVNLLRDKLVYRASIVTVDDRHRVLNSRAAYDAIGTAYSELRDEIDEAASLA